MADAGFCDPPGCELVVAGHDMRVVAAGSERLDALLALIEGAQRSLSLAFYIFADDRAGNRVVAALAEAAKRGIDVRLIVDGFGIAGDDSHLAPIRRAGGKVWVFSPKWSRRFLIRNHQKFVIADAQRALIGGFNVSDDYFAPPAEQGWADLGLELKGAAVDALVRWFAELEGWVSHPRSQWLAMERAVRGWNGGCGPVQLLIGGPTARLSSWARSVRSDLDRGARLDMMMAYFSPSSGVLRKIAALARRGRARLVMAGKSDNGATIGATRSLYSYLLGAGVEISEFRATKLHTKLLVIDDVTYIGSANFDMRSLYLNLELMLRVEDRALASEMRKLIDAYEQGAKPITPENHAAKATLFNRIRWNLSWFLVAVLDYNVARRLNLGL